MNKELFEIAKEFAGKKYITSIVLEKDIEGKDRYLAVNPELFGCMAQGDTPEEAEENLFLARIDYIYDYLVDGDEVPKPNYFANIITGCAEESTHTIRVSLPYRNSDTIDTHTRIANQNNEYNYELIS